MIDDPQWHRDDPARGAPTPGEVELLDSVETDPTIPAAGPAPRRRLGRRGVAVLLTAALVLVGGGVAYGVAFLHRPDVMLARALSSTQGMPSGDVRITVSTDAASLSALGVRDPQGSVLHQIQSSAVRWAWGTDVQQLSADYDGSPLVDMITTPEHLTLEADLATSNDSALRVVAHQLRAMAGSMGPDASFLVDLADGLPVGLSIGPDSAVAKLLTRAQASGGKTASADPSAAQFSQLGDAMASSLRQHTLVTAQGSDEYGDHLRSSVDLKPVVADAWAHMTDLVPGAPTSITAADLAQLDGVTLDIDVWVKDGVISKVEIPMGDFLQKLGSRSITTPLTFTVVGMVGTDGVHQPDAKVHEVPDSALQSLVDRMGVGMAGA
jgi:hypothetical protein